MNYEPPTRTLQKSPNFEPTNFDPTLGTQNNLSLRPKLSSGAFGCFHFATETGGMNWFHAQQYCQDLESGAWLAEIPDDITQSLLYGFMADLPNYEWWVGGDDLWKVSFN